MKKSVLLYLCITICISIGLLLSSPSSKTQPSRNYSAEELFIEQDVPLQTNETIPDCDTESDVVYVTDTGHKYHKLGCSYLKSQTETTVENALSEGYTPCSRCY